jgi:hypothetical protein
MDIREIEYRWVLEPDGEIYTADVVVGDGSVEFDENYPEYDERIFFYFTDEAEFTLARKGKLEGCEFEIVGVEV